MSHLSPLETINKFESTNNITAGKPNPFFSNDYILLNAKTNLKSLYKHSV